MILERNGTENKRPSTNINGNKTFYSFSVTPGRTNYIFKKTKLNEDMQVNCLPEPKSHRENESSPPYNRQKQKNKNLVNLTIQENNQVSCTSFMKSYVDKLKKQRKRQNKKLLNAKQQKQEVQKNSIFNKTDLIKNDFYLAKQMNHIFILQRVSKSGGNSLMNTISVVQQDVNNLQYNNINNKLPNKNQKNIKQLEWDQPAWANKQKIDKLIKQIRNSRNKVSDAQQISIISEQLQKTRNINNLNLPTLSLKSRQIKNRINNKSRNRSKRLNRTGQINFKSLEPWKEQNNSNQFTIQEYNINSSRLI